MDAEKTLLSLDLSTTCTGYSLLGITSKKLLHYGKLKPKTSGEVAKMGYPKQQLTKMIDLSNQVLQLIESYKPHVIVIEEITGSKNRLGQKTLDGYHYFLVWIIQKYIDIVRYQDVGGTQGWRTFLQLRLSEADKLSNSQAKKLNKKLHSSQKIPIITAKHLACRFVNRQFGTNFDVDASSTDSDVTDSIAMGFAFLTFCYADIPK